MNKTFTFYSLTSEDDLFYPIHLSEVDPIENFIFIQSENEELFIDENFINYFINGSLLFRYSCTKSCPAVTFHYNAAKYKI